MFLDNSVVANGIALGAGPFVNLGDGI